MSKINLRAISLFNGVRRASCKVAKAEKAQPAAAKSTKAGKAHPAKLRSSITPGTVLILLAGRFKGKRVVCLKQLPSGLLLVTGPYKYNGVPLKRVNQAFVIATKTKVDVSSVKVDEKINDNLFKKPAGAAKAKSFFDKKSPKKSETSELRKTLQKSVDSQLMPIVKKTPLLRSYLGSRFSLKKGQALHNLQF